MLLSLVYRLLRCLFGLLAVLFRPDLSKDADQCETARTASPRMQQRQRPSWYLP